MIRGTTAQFKFKLPYKYNELQYVKVTFWQPGNNGPADDRPLPIVKALYHCAQADTESELSVTLTQEETLRFSEKKKAYVQLRATAIDGHTFASQQEQITVYPVYDDSVLDDFVEPTPDGNGMIFLDGGSIA